MANAIMYEVDVRDPKGRAILLVDTGLTDPTTGNPVYTEGTAVSGSVEITNDTGSPISTTSAAGSVVGEVKNSLSLEITRPADTTAYAALDVFGVNLAVSNATHATPVVITCDTHGLADGDPVTIASVGGTTAANGNMFAKVTGYSGTTFGVYSDKALTTPVVGNADYTSGGTVARLFRLPNLARVNGGTGDILKVQLFTSQKTDTARYKMHIFNAPVTAILDNSPYLKLYANVPYRSGEILFPAMATEDPTNSTAASTIVTPNTAGSNLPLPFVAAANDRDLYFMLERLDIAATPDSGQKMTVRVLLRQD